MPKDNKLLKDAENIARLPIKAANSGGEFLATGKVTPDPTGKNKFTQAELSALGRLSKPRSARPAHNTAFGKAVTGAVRGVKGAADRFDRGSTELADGIRASLRRKRPKQDEAPELRE